MSRTLIVGDVHLGRSTSIGVPGIGTAVNSRVADQIKLLDWIIEQASENCVNKIILTGDVCEDVKPDYAIVNIFFEFLKKCEANTIDVHIVAGNHDIRRTGAHYMSILDLITTSEMKNAHVHKHTNTIYNDGVCFTLFPFRDRRSLDCDVGSKAIDILAEKIPYELAEIPIGWDKVLIGHMALEGSLPVGDEIDDYANELMCPLSMFSGYDYVWMGHIHRPQVRSEKPYIAHIGSLDISDFGEMDHKKIIILFDTEDPDRFKEILVPSRPLRKIAFTIPSQFETTEYVLEQIAVMNEAKPFYEAIVRVELKLSAEAINADRDKIWQELKALGAHHICNFSETRAMSAITGIKQDVDNGISPKTAVKLWAEQLKFDSDDDKNEYIRTALSVIDRHNSTGK